MGNRWAFSTLGCSGLPIAEVAALARRTGWSGLELRAAPDEPVHCGLSAAGRAAVRRELGDLTVLCVASYVKVASPSIADNACVTEAIEHANLARDLGARAVRVFPGGAAAATEGSPDRVAHGDAIAVRRLRAIADRLPAGVEIWLETHDSHPRGADIARILGEVDDPRVRAIWDVLHPWRTGEPVADTAAVLAPWLAHVQVKDVASATELTPVPPGQGTVPLTEVLARLRDRGYRGWLSLEWERKWHPTAIPLAEALVAGAAWLATRDHP